MKRFNKEIKRLKLLSTGIFGVNKQNLKKTTNVMDDAFYYAGISQEKKHILIIRYYILATLIFSVTILCFLINRGASCYG